MRKPYVQAVVIVAVQFIILATLLLQKEGEPSSFSDQQRLARNFGTDTFHGQWDS